MSGGKIPDDAMERLPINGGSPSEAPRRFTSKQMGDACEMLVAAELTLAGIPALKVPDNWPGYDIGAQPSDRPVQRISVKSRTFKRGSSFVDYWTQDVFDWLAIVILSRDNHSDRQIYIIPRAVADLKARRDSLQSKTANQRYWRIDHIDQIFSMYRDNFTLNDEGGQELSCLQTAAADA